jgi:hypothetical protein
MNSHSQNPKCDAERTLHLPREIERMLSENLEITLAGCFGHPLIEPTADPVELLKQFQSHPDCSWSLKLGDVVALEYSPQVGGYALAHLCNQDWEEWPETLQYRWGRSLYLLYRAEAIKTRELGRRFTGVRLYCRGLLPIAPSCFGNGPQLHFARLSAPMLCLPKWLYSDGRNNKYVDAA